MYRLVHEHRVEGGSSKVDFVVLADDRFTVLVEAKSPSVMRKVGDLLPPRGFELKWHQRQSLLPKILSKVSTLFCVSAIFEETRIGCVVSGS